jgi:hypothetical protein
MRVVLTTATVALLLTACSDGGTEARDFCDDLSNVRGQLATLGQGDPAAFADVVDRLETIDPPDEIADSYRAVLEVYTAIADDGEATLTDPEFGTRFADVRADIDRIDEYISDTCTDERAPDRE